MTGLTDEALATQDTPLDAALRAGIDAISYFQNITFTAYARVVLPVDGYVFWVRADLLSQAAIFNAMRFNSVAMNASERVIAPAPQLVVKGSLHYATDLSQNESETLATNRVIMTSESEIQDFNLVGPNLIYIGEFDGIRFAFSQRGSFYRQADIFHYVGNAIFSTMETQFIDDAKQLTNTQIVSNSLPIWLSINRHPDYDWEYFHKPPFPLFPSMLAAQNLPPPFATVHIEPGGTVAFASTPTLGPKLEHVQLCRDTVRIVMYGANNEMALNFQDFVNQFSLNWNQIGIMNVPVVRDDKRGQVEFGILAQRKVIEFEVSYLQSVSRNIARQLIKEAIITYEFGP